MKQSLTLPPSTRHITHPTIVPHLGYVSYYRFPSFYLSLVFFWNSSPHIIAAIPLKPSSRIIFVYPPILFPYRKWLRGIHTKIVKLWIMLFRTQFCLSKPRCRKFIFAIGHILTTKHPELKHLLRC